MTTYPIFQKINQTLQSLRQTSPAFCLCMEFSSRNGCRTSLNRIHFPRNIAHYAILIHSGGSWWYCGRHDAFLGCESHKLYRYCDDVLCVVSLLWFSVNAVYILRNCSHSISNKIIIIFSVDTRTDACISRLRPQRGNHKRYIRTQCVYNKMHPSATERSPSISQVLSMAGDRKQQVG